MNPLLSVSGLSAGYGRHRILENISFTLETGTVTGLLGPNGCGKTTLLKALCCSLPHTGSCTLHGATPQTAGKAPISLSLEKLSVKERARYVSYIPQRCGVTISLPVLDVVLMGFNARLGLLQSPSPAQQAQARAALAATGMAALEKASFLSLSEGQKQLCILARTLVEDTQLLLLDEPDSALDFPNRHLIMSCLEKLIKNPTPPSPGRQKTVPGESKKAALLCLHDPQLALSHCDQLLLLKDGRCMDILSPKTDSTDRIQEALTLLYGPLTITRCTDQAGRSHLVILPHLQ